MPRPLPSRNLRMVTLRAPLALLVAALLAVTPSNAQDPPDPRIKAGELYAAAQKARNEGDYHRALALYKKTFDVLNMQCSPGTVMLLLEISDTSREALQANAPTERICPALRILEETDCTATNEVSRALETLRKALAERGVACDLTILPLDRPANLVEVPSVLNSSPPSVIQDTERQPRPAPTQGRGLRVTASLILPLGLTAGGAAIYGAAQGAADNRWAEVHCLATDETASPWEISEMSHESCPTRLARGERMNTLAIAMTATASTLVLSSAFMFIAAHIRTKNHRTPSSGLRAWLTPVVRF